MKKVALSVVLVAVLAVGGMQASWGVSLSNKSFKNCTELRKTYPGGVALSKTSQNKGGKIKKTPTVNAKVYKSNQSKDRDHDGIACEN